MREGFIFHVTVDRQMYDYLCRDDVKNATIIKKMNQYYMSQLGITIINDDRIAEKAAQYQVVEVDTPSLFDTLTFPFIDFAVDKDGMLYVYVGKIED